LFVTDEIRLRILVAMGWTAEAEGDAERAATYFRRTLGSSLGTGSLRLAADAADGLAAVALLEHRPADAARLLGAAAVLRGRHAAGDPDIERVTAAARAELGDRAFETARAETATLPSPEAARWVGAWSAFGA
jgi:hypothetical protein